MGEWTGKWTGRLGKKCKCASAERKMERRELNNVLMQNILMQ